MPQYTINIAYKGAVLDTLRIKRHGGTFSNGGGSTNKENLLTSWCYSGWVGKDTSY